MNWQIVAIVIIFVFIFKSVWNKIYYWQHRNICSPPGHWLFGHTGGNALDIPIHDLVFKYYRQFARDKFPVIGLKVFGRPMLLVMKAEIAKRILIQDFSHFQNRGLYHTLDDLSSNLFTLEYEKWKKIRSRLTPVFTISKLRSMIPTFVNVSEDLVNVLENTIRATEGIVDVRNLMLRFTIDVLGSCSFGIQTNSLTYPDNEFSKVIKSKAMGEENTELSKFVLFNFHTVAHLLRLKYMPKQLVDFYTQFIHLVVTLRETHKIRHNDFMDILMDMRNSNETGLTLQEMTSNALLFFQAGYETSAFTLTYIIYELARHLDIQQKARMEIYAVLNDCNNELTYECLGRMKYLTQIIKETLRLYPVAPTLLRECTKDYTISNDSTLPPITIQKGQMVIISAYSLQRDDQYYNEAEKFNPENFADEKSNDNLFLSFGDGPRNCIGMRFANMQTLIGLMLLLKNFTFTFCEKTEEPIQFKTASVMLSPQNEIYLKVIKYSPTKD